MCNKNTSVKCDTCIKVHTIMLVTDVSHSELLVRQLKGLVTFMEQHSPNTEGVESVKKTFSSRKIEQQVQT